MATFSKNIKKIQGEAYLGTDMRTAIAEALQQVADVDISIDNEVVLIIDRIGQTNDYQIEFVIGNT